MSAIKQNNETQHFFFQQQKTVDLTQQERNALSLVWSDNEADNKPAARYEVDTAHCAILGYN